MSHHSEVTPTGTATPTRSKTPATVESFTGVAAALAPVPAPGTAPGSHLPGVQAAGALYRDGRIVAITTVANAVPGKPDGEVDTRPLRPIWQHADDQEWWHAPVTTGAHTPQWATDDAPHHRPGRENVPAARDIATRPGPARITAACRHLLAIPCKWIRRDC